MKVLILGGTGAMGVHLVHLLAESGNEIRVTSRKARRSPQKNVCYAEGNAHDPTFLQPILDERWDVIVDFLSYTTTEFRERAHLLPEAASQYIFLSSARVYADSKQPLTESSPRLLDTSTDGAFLSTDEYALAKARQEDILKNSGFQNWTIIRPYITYSENRLQLGVLEKEEWLYRALHGRTIVFSRDIHPMATTMTYGLDVAKGIMAIAGNPAALGEIFHITGSESCRWDEILTTYLDALEIYLGYRPKVCFQDLKRFMQCTPGKYQVRYDRLFNRQFDSSKIGRYVNIREFTKTGTGLRTCLDEFLKNPVFSDINWKLEASKDRQTKEHTPLSEIPGITKKIKYLRYRYLFI